jgi:hypothetical protein
MSTELDRDVKAFESALVACVRTYLSTDDAYFIARAFMDYPHRVSDLICAHAGEQMRPEELARWALRLAKRVRAEGTVKPS